MAGDLEAKYGGIAARADSPGPAAERIVEVLKRGKREQLLAGVDADGEDFAPLAASTLKRPRQCPTPLIPDGPESGLILGYSVEVAAAPGRLEISAGWPDRDYVRYHRTGTARMPRRDPGGFRAADRQECLSILSEHINGPDR
jgi:hypothetical protein